MGLAVDTILAFSTQAGAAAFPTALAATVGDSLTIRATVGESKAHIEAIITGSDAGGNKFRVTSPLLHDNVTGLTFKPGENPSPFLLPLETSLEVNEQDTLSAFGQCGAATTITMGIVVMYENLRGTAADLYRWSDIAPDIKTYKSVEVSGSAIAVGAWTDTSITATEDQLHADKSYAVIGYDVNPAVDIVGVKGVATGNLRMCGPGPNSSLRISDYFVAQSIENNMPYIPVFQANDRKAFFVSAANHAALGGGAYEVMLLVAELKTKR
jgi:hypothetical protein